MEPAVGAVMLAASTSSETGTSRSTIGCQASHHAGSQRSLCRLCLCLPEALLGGGSLCGGASCCSCSRSGACCVSAVKCGNSPV